MATEEAATMARKMGRVRPQRKETCSIAIPCQRPVRLWHPSRRRVDLHGSSRSARRFMSGPSPGFGAGVIHLFCCLPAVCLPLSADASLRLIMRDSIVPSVATGEGRNGRGGMMFRLVARRVGPNFAACRVSEPRPPPAAAHIVIPAPLAPPRSGDTPTTPGAVLRSPITLFVPRPLIPL